MHCGAIPRRWDTDTGPEWVQESGLDHVHALGYWSPITPEQLLRQAEGLGDPWREERQAQVQPYDPGADWRELRISEAAQRIRWRNVRDALFLIAALGSFVWWTLGGNAWLFMIACFLVSTPSVLRSHRQYRESTRRPETTELRAGRDIDWT